MCHIFLDSYYEAKFSFFKGVSVRFNGLNYECGGDDIPESLARKINNAPFLTRVLSSICASLFLHVMMAFLRIWLMITMASLDFHEAVCWLDNLVLLYIMVWRLLFLQWPQVVSLRTWLLKSELDELNPLLGKGHVNCIDLDVLNCL